MNNAPIEYEVKFFPIGINNMRATLKKVGALLKTPERLMLRSVFSQDANPKMNCTYIRVRDEGNKVTFSAKQHSQNNVIAEQKEIETTVKNFEDTRQILKAAGLVEAGFQENKRETWQMPDGTLVELETWPQLPNYLEIEGASESAVKQTAELLGLRWSEHIIDSNDYLYSKHYNLSKTEVFKRFSYLTFK